MKLDRLELADLGAPERLASAIWAQVPDMPLPVPVEEIAHQLDIKEIRRIKTDGFEGGLIAWDDKSEGAILVNTSGSRQRQRFTISHELGHFLSPWHKSATDQGFRCTSRDMRVVKAKPGDRRMQMEAEANVFAAELLMSRPRFQKDLRSRPGLDVAHIPDMARKYDTSKEATARRYVELQDEVSAVVVVHQGKVIRTYRHPDFPYVSVKAGDPVPAASLSARDNLVAAEPSDWNELDRGIWIDSRAPGTMLEQVLPQQQGYRLVLLALSEVAEEDEEDSVTGWETPRFQR